MLRNGQSAWRASKARKSARATGPGARAIGLRAAFPSRCAGSAQLARGVLLTGATARGKQGAAGLGFSFAVILPPPRPSLRLPSIESAKVNRQQSEPNGRKCRIFDRPFLGSAAISGAAPKRRRDKHNGRFCLGKLLSGFVSSLNIKDTNKTSLFSLFSLGLAKNKKSQAVE